MDLNVTLFDIGDDEPSVLEFICCFKGEFCCGILLLFDEEETDEEEDGDEDEEEDEDDNDDVDGDGGETFRFSTPLLTGSGTNRFSILLRDWIFKTVESGGWIIVLLVLFVVDDDEDDDDDDEEDDEDEDEGDADEHCIELVFDDQDDVFATVVADEDEEDGDDIRLSKTGLFSLRCI